MGKVVHNSGARSVADMKAAQPPWDVVLDPGRIDVHPYSRLWFTIGGEGRHYVGVLQCAGGKGMHYLLPLDPWRVADGTPPPRIPDRKRKPGSARVILHIPQYFSDRLESQASRMEAKAAAATTGPTTSESAQIARMRALTQFGTSHSQIVQHFGLDRNECIGYALKKRTGGHELSCQSQTLNLRKFGDVTQSTDNAYLPQPWIDCVRLSLERLLPDMEGNVTAQGDAFAAEDFLDPEWLR